MNGVQELSLMTSDFAGVDLFRQRRVFVDEPRLPKDIGGGILQLHIVARIRYFI